MSSVYIIWQDQYSKLWHPVAKLTRENGLFRLNYTKGAVSSSNFIPFPKMDDLGKVYESNELFPFFQNRILPKSRPEFRSLISWLDMTIENFDPLEYLGVTGGVRKTDNYRILKLPELKNGKYVYDFLISGIHYIDDFSKNRVLKLKEGSELEFFFEDDNPVDKNAIALKDKETGAFIGYCPRYLVNDFRKLIGDNSNKKATFKVKKINSDAPASYRVVCRFESADVDEYKPLMFEEYMAHTIVH